MLPQMKRPGSLAAGRAGAAAVPAVRWRRTVGLGICLTIGGLLAGLGLIAAPVAQVVWIGAIMLVMGLLHLAHALGLPHRGPRLTLALGGLCLAGAGLAATFDPMFVSLGLTMVIGVCLIASGAVRVSMGMNAQAARGNGWLLATGMVTLAVGAFVIAYWPPRAGWMIAGALVFDLLTEGGAYIGLGLAQRAGG